MRSTSVVASPGGPVEATRYLSGLSEDLADLYTRLDETEANTANLPHRRKYLLLVIGFLRRLLQLHEQMVDEVERELTPHARRGRSREASPHDEHRKRIGGVGEH